MRLALHRHRPAPVAQPRLEPGPEPMDLDAELRELLLAEYAQPALIILPGAAFLVRPIRPPRRRAAARRR
jgi:hypothetical protein